MKKILLAISVALVAGLGSCAEQAPEEEVDTNVYEETLEAQDEVDDINSELEELESVEEELEDLEDELDNI